MTDPREHRIAIEFERARMTVRLTMDVRAFARMVIEQRKAGGAVEEHAEYCMNQLDTETREIVDELIEEIDDPDQPVLEDVVPRPR